MPAAATFVDSDGGATCRYYSTFGMLAWQREGGDWVDARGAAYGAAPFDQAAAPAGGAGVALTLNLATLGEAWQRGTVPMGSVMLRGDSTKSGVIDLASREGAPPEQAPQLKVVWDDGTTETLAAVADTYLACPTLTNLGKLGYMKVSAAEAALIVFPLRWREGHKLRQLSMRVFSPRQYGSAQSVGVFGPVLPHAAKIEQKGLSDDQPQDAGLTSGKVWFRETFDEGNRWRILAAGVENLNSVSVVDSDPGNAFQPLSGRALRVVVRKGARQALNHQIKLAELAGREPEEAYFRYHLRFGSSWDPVVDGGKMPGFAGTYNRAGWGNRPTDGYNGWSARGSFFRHEPKIDTPYRVLGTGAYTAATRDQYGETWGWNLGPTGRLLKNRWYAVEQYVKMNTPGKPDGIFRVWIDGEIAFSKEDVHWRNTEALKVETVWMNVYHGGIEDADRDLTLYIDNLVIAPRYIGPGRFAR